MDAEARSMLDAMSARAAAETTLTVHRTVDIAGRLEDAGLPYLVFKGVGLIANLYREPALRMVSDCDVLIEPESLRDACRVLTEAGYMPEEGFRIEDFDTWIAPRADLPRMVPQALIMTNAEGSEIDLHWTLGRNPPARMTAATLVSRAEKADLAGAQIRVPGPVDAMLLTIQHALRDWFMPASTIKDLCDLVAWCELDQPRWDPFEFAAAAKDALMLAPALAMFRLVASGSQSAAAHRSVEAIGAGGAVEAPKQAAKLLRLFDDQLRGSLNPDLLLLLSAPGTAARALTSRGLKGKRRTHSPSNLYWFTRDLPAGHPRSVAGRIKKLVLDAARSLPAYRAVVEAHSTYR